MGKITKKQWAIASCNQVPRTTVYKRIQRGWDVERAVRTPPVEQVRLREKGGKFTGKTKGKPRSFRMPVDWDEKMDSAIAESGLSEGEWIAIALVNELKRSSNGHN